MYQRVVWDRPTLNRSILIGTFLISHFIDRILLTEQNFEPRNLPPDSLLTHNQQKEKIQNILFVDDSSPNYKHYEHISETKDSPCATNVFHVILNLNTEKEILVTTTSPGLLTIEPHHIWSSLQHVLSSLQHNKDCTGSTVLHLDLRVLQHGSTPSQANKDNPWKEFPRRLTGNRIR